MKKLLLLLLLVLPFLASTSSFAQDRERGNRPRMKSNRAFGHSAEASKDRNSKARFRPVNNIKPTIDLRPHSLERFKTAKAPKNYKFSNGNGFKPVK